MQPAPSRPSERDMEQTAGSGEERCDAHPFAHDTATGSLLHAHAVMLGASTIAAASPTPAPRDPGQLTALSAS
jgi:hypothetical protein